jgi:DNA endonuclease
VTDAEVADSNKSHSESKPIRQRRFQSLDVRVSLHEEVLHLRQKSYSYRQIMDEIKKGHGVSLSKGTISNWTRELHSPLQAGHRFIPKPTPELAYVIGVETGDGFLNVMSETYRYRIRLRAVDREFVEAFNQAVAKVLRCRPHRLWKGRATREFEVEYGSYFLHRFLLQRLEDKKAFVEHDEMCAAAFIRGFFDSEGCVDASGRKITAYNNDLTLLKYVQELLLGCFGIETTGPYLHIRKGTILTRRGKSYVRNGDGYYIYVRAKYRAAFYRKIGLTIERKKSRLEKKLGLKTSQKD